MKRGQRPRRQIVCVLVEGDSERTALSQTLEALYDEYNPEIMVYFPRLVDKQLDGDITVKKGINEKTIQGCIVKLFLKPFMEQEKLYAKDIKEIIHIVDLDGAYIDDSSIVFGQNPLGVEKVYYAENQIITKNVDGIIERNARKRENIDQLCSQTTLKVDTKTIPYSVYFFSSNLDHCLHNDANIIEGREKVEKAEKFAMQFQDKPYDFVDAIKKLPGTLLDLTYEESWNFIRERGNHSLERHTNINLFFDKLLG